MLYRYIAMDMDGTLLNAEKKIGNVTLNELQKLKTNGCRIILASGRHFQGIVTYIRELELAKADIIICCDGQYIYNGLGEIIWHGPFLSLRDVKKISNLIGYRSISCYTDLIDIYIEYNIFKKIKRTISAKLNHKKILQVSNPERAHEYMNKIEKIVFSSSLLSEENKKQIKKNYTIHYSKNNQIELLHKEVNKYHALKVLDTMGLIDINQVIYFGDDANDLECFMNMNTCIAMGNALEELKSHALFITKSCNEDGVGYALQEINKIGKLSFDS